MQAGLVKSNAALLIYNLTIKRSLVNMHTQTLLIFTAVVLEYFFQGPLH